MKKIIIIAIAMIAAVFTANAQTAKNIYMKYSDLKGVEAVYVSPAVFNMLKTVPEIEIADGDVDVSNIIMNLRGVYVLDVENREVGKRLYDDVMKSVGKKYELMMEAKMDGEHTAIYVTSKDDIISSMVVLSTEADGEVSWVCLDADIPYETLRRLIAGMED